MHFNKLKILLIGPTGSGKTSIANFISDSINIEEAGTPRPTQGVRIVEFELTNINVNGKNDSIDIELWDCSGDHSHQMTKTKKELIEPRPRDYNNIKNLQQQIKTGAVEKNIIKFESCWPALRNGVQGTILVCSPNTNANASRELELLYNYFVSQPKLSAKQCVVFYNNIDEQDYNGELNLSPTFAKVSQVMTNIKSGGNRLKIDFSNFVSSVVQALKAPES